MIIVIGRMSRPSAFHFFRAHSVTPPSHVVSWLEHGLNDQPRTATAQLNAATIVSNPQPGDLVFTVSGGIATHVGIYTGPGMMIDSPRTGKATSERAIFSGNVYGRF